MTFPNRIRGRWLGRLALGLTVAAVVVPAAQAYDYHQPFGPGLDTASLPCTPSCGFPQDRTAAVVAPTIERAHPRGVGPGTASSRTIEIPALAGHYRVPLGLERTVEQHDGTSVGLSEAGAGIGIGAAFAALLAGLAAMLTRKRDGLAHA